MDDLGFNQGKCSKELREELNKKKKNKDYKAIISKSMICVYEIRNRLFHQGEAHKLMEDSSYLLRDIIRGCIKQHLESSAKGKKIIEKFFHLK